MVKDQDEAALSALDVGGYNYSPNRYDVDHAKYPDRVMVGTESFPQSSFEMWGASNPLMALSKRTLGLRRQNVA